MSDLSASLLAIPFASPVPGAAAPDAATHTDDGSASAAQASKTDRS